MKSGIVKSSNFVLCQDDFGHSGLHFHMHFKIRLSISSKIPVGILTEIVLSLHINFSSIAILTILSLPIHKHGTSFHLFRSLISFSMMFCSSQCTTLAVFAKLIPKYIILFDDIINGIVFWISLSGYSLLIYRHTINFLYWFCIMQLCGTWVLLLIFLRVDTLVFYIHEIMASANRDFSSDCTIQF